MLPCDIAQTANKDFSGDDITAFDVMMMKPIPASLTRNVTCEVTTIPRKEQCCLATDLNCTLLMYNFS